MSAPFEFLGRAAEIDRIVEFIRAPVTDGFARKAAASEVTLIGLGDLF